MDDEIGSTDKFLLVLSPDSNNGRVMYSGLGRIA